MSGGVLDYFNCREPMAIVKAELSFGKGRYSERTLENFKKTLRALKMAEIYAHRTEWLLSGDDGEETYNSTLDEELNEFENNEEEIIPREPECRYCENCTEEDGVECCKFSFYRGFEKEKEHNDDPKKCYGFKPLVCK